MNKRLVPVKNTGTRVNIYFPVEVLEKIDEVAARYDLSRSALLRYCFEVWLSLVETTISEEEQNA